MQIGEQLLVIPAAELRLPPDLPSLQRDFVCHRSRGVCPHTAVLSRCTAQRVRTLAAAKGPKTV